ncbi:MAG: serine O-acetyltransferase [Candidatus Geothermincolia bacterium]
MFDNTLHDLQAIRERDPAARSTIEIVLAYPGLHAIWGHRVAHRLWQWRLPLVPRLLSQAMRRRTGIEIHPGARIGNGVFMDHGMGIVIGETAEIADDVTLYQGVTLGGTGKMRGKRHPTIARGVVVGCGASVLGPIEVGEGAKVGSGAVVTRSVPPGATVVGIPARPVAMSWETPPGCNGGDSGDPIAETFSCYNTRIDRLEHYKENAERELDELRLRLEMAEKSLKAIGGRAPRAKAATAREDGGKDAHR